MGHSRGIALPDASFDRDDQGTEPVEHAGDFVPVPVPQQSLSCFSETLGLFAKGTIKKFRKNSLQKGQPLVKGGVQSPCYHLPSFPDKSFSKLSIKR